MRSRDVASEGEVLVPWQTVEPAVSVEDLAVEADGLPAGAAPRALRITLDADGEPVIDHWFHARGLAARRWHIGGFEFSGRWVLWREDSRGRVLRVVSHAGALLPCQVSGSTHAPRVQLPADVAPSARPSGPSHKSPIS